MLSVLFGTTTITMNREEQETLYRQARNLRLHQETKAQHNSSSQQQTHKPRHHSYGNIHQIHSKQQQSHPPQGMNFRSSFGYDDHRTLNATACDDLVLSVLKSPLRDQSLLSNLSSVAATSVNSDSVEGSHKFSTVTTLTTATVGDNNNETNPRDYTVLQASEDDLNDDELSMETTELNDKHRDSTNNSNLSPYGLRFLRRFRAPKFEAHHHRRVPTPMKRKHNRGRSKSTADILDVGVSAINAANDEEVAMQDGGGEEGLEGGR